MDGGARSIIRRAGLQGLHLHLGHEWHGVQVVVHCLEASGKSPGRDSLTGGVNNAEKYSRQGEAKSRIRTENEAELLLLPRVGFRAAMR